MCKRITLFAITALALLIQPATLLSSDSSDSSADFDGDGTVSIPDFLAFVEHFGASRGDEKYEAKYDLDGDGTVGIPDFLAFVNQFGSPSGEDSASISIPDTNLHDAITDHLGKASGEAVTAAEMATLTHLDARNRDIRDLTGLECATNLTRLILPYNQITDVSPLSNLTNLWQLHIGENRTISDVSPLSNLTGLTWLALGGNLITDISALSNLTNLGTLWLYENNISDLAPLVANRGLGSGDEVDLRTNPLSTRSRNTHVPALQARGVEVLF